MDRKTIKTVILTAVVILGAIAIFQGVSAIKRGDAPGRQAAAYLETLINLGQLPTGAQVDAAVAQAQAKANMPAPAPLTPEQLGGKYVDKIPEGEVSSDRRATMPPGEVVSSPPVKK